MADHQTTTPTAPYPVADAASAHAMQHQALLLLAAGTITRERKHLVDDLAADMLMAAFARTDGDTTQAGHFRHAA